MINNGHSSSTKMLYGFFFPPNEPSENYARTSIYASLYMRNIAREEYGRKTLGPNRTRNYFIDHCMREMCEKTVLETVKT